MKPVRWRGAWLIGAPRARVYELMTDFERWPERFPEMVKFIQVVSRADTSAVLEGEFDLLGRRGRGRMHLKLQPPSGYDADNTSAEFGREKEKLRFEEIPEGTLFKWEVEAEPKGFFDHLLGRFAGFYVRRFYEKTLIGPLKKAVEGQE